MSDTKVNLPKTQLGMKANLPTKEPELLKFWSEISLYDNLRSNSATKEKFVLHDGPPLERKRKSNSWKEDWKKAWF